MCSLAAKSSESFRPGRIVYALDEIADPQGGNPKPNRPFVIISSKEDIAKRDTITVVAVSHRIMGEAFEVVLPFGPNCLTRFNSKSAAICNWRIDLRKDRVDCSKGFVPPKELEEIKRKVAETLG